MVRVHSDAPFHEVRYIVFNKYDNLSTPLIYQSPSSLSITLHLVNTAVSRPEFNHSTYCIDAKNIACLLKISPYLSIAVHRQPRKFCTSVCTSICTSVCTSKSSMLALPIRLKLSLAIKSSQYTEAFRQGISCKYFAGGDLCL